MGDFFGMGMGEILLILVVTLIAWKPARIVDIAQTLGRTVRTLRKVTADLTTAVTKEIDIEEEKRPSRSRAKSGDNTEGSPDTGTAEAGSTETTSPRD